MRWVLDDVFLLKQLFTHVHFRNEFIFQSYSNLLFFNMFQTCIRNKPCFVVVRLIDGGDMAATSVVSTELNISCFVLVLSFVLQSYAGFLELKIAFCAGMCRLVCSVCVFICIPFCVKLIFKISASIEEIAVCVCVRAHFPGAFTSRSTSVRCLQHRNGITLRYHLPHQLRIRILLRTFLVYRKPFAIFVRDIRYFFGHKVRAENVPVLKFNLRSQHTHLKL